MGLSQEVKELKNRVQELENRDKEREEVIQGLIAKLDPNPGLQIRSTKDAVVFWALVRDLTDRWEDWDPENDIRTFCSYAWYLMSRELHLLAKVSGDKLAWRMVLDLLQEMRHYLETHLQYKKRLDLKFVSENLAAAEARLNAAVVNYLIEYEPEVYDQVRDYLENHLDKVAIPRG